MPRSESPCSLLRAARPAGPRGRAQCRSPNMHTPRGPDPPGGSAGGPGFPLAQPRLGGGGPLASRDALANLPSPCPPPFPSVVCAVRGHRVPSCHFYDRNGRAGRGSETSPGPQEPPRDGAPGLLTSPPSRVSLDAGCLTTFPRTWTSPLCAPSNHSPSIWSPRATTARASGAQSRADSGVSRTEPEPRGDT